MKGRSDSNGTKLIFQDSGSGSPVVFLHPTPLDHDYWRPMLGNLAGIRAIAPDLRGHGRSELGSDLPVGGFSRVPDAPVLTIAQLAEDVIGLIDHLQIETAIFAGCSIGGYILLELWRHIPKRMSGLIFVCSKAQPDAEANLEKRVANINKIRSEGAGVFFDGSVGTLLGASSQTKHPGLAAEVRARMNLTAEAAVAVQAGLATRPDSLPTVKTIDVPILAIAGCEDTGITPAEMEAFQAAPGGCEFYLLPDAGHFAAYEQPEKVARLIAGWLKQPDSTATLL